GLSGTGKSALARDLAPEIAPAPGAVLLRADVERKAHFGVHETERLPADAYAPAISTAIYTDLARKAARILRAGHSATIDAVFSRPHERGAAAAVAAEHGVAFHGLFLTADLATRIARVGTRSGDASDADESVARAQEAYDIGALDWAHIDASGSQSDTLARARAALTI
ncbi:MAG: AAA family ATPase, partial [Proteobacteria bacterium]|nr:AAA family ATPase [Pseudomonadota bacterium]